MSRMRTRTLATTVATAAVALLAVGPATAGAATYCPSEPTELLADGSVLFSNEANEAGCVTARAYSDGRIGLHGVVVAPGWSYSVKSSDANRVQVQFTQSATRQRVDVRIEPGRTVIK
jgi:hypothetical protein